MPQKKRIVTITGATGFVGRHTVERLLADGRFSLRCLVRPSSDTRALTALSNDLAFVQGDITDPDTLPAAFEGAWGVINLAGYREFWSRRRAHFYALNEHGARNVFKACLAAKVSKVVQVSTPLAYGAPDSIPFHEDTPAGPHPSDYARSKSLGDAAGWALHEQRGLPLTVVHLAAVIGAGDDKATMEVKRAMDGNLPALVGAETTYTYVYVRDAADAIFRALVKRDAIGKRYLIGNQRATTREYFNLIGELAGVAIPQRNIPEAWLMPLAHTLEWAASLTGRRPLLPVDVLKTTMAGSLLFDATRSIEELGMRYTPLATALEESIAALRTAA